MRVIVSLVMLITTALQVNAKGNKVDEKYFTIADVKISIVEEVSINKSKGEDQSSNPVPAPDELPKPPEPPTPTPPPPPQPDNIAATLDTVNAVLDTIDKIVNLAQKIWEIIEKNQPVVDISVNYANAVPYGIQHWTQLQGWSKPKTQKYSFVVKNMYGMEVVKVVYQVHATYGGNYQGKGKFLTGVTIEPISVKTLLGYSVSLKAEVPDSTITNVGTHEDPIAAMQVKLKWVIHTKFKDLQQQVIYYVDGTGKIKEIASPFKKSDVRSVKVEPVELKLEEKNSVVEKINSANFE